MGPPKIIATVIPFSMNWQFVLLGRGPLLLPLHLDFLEISGYIMNKNITLRYLSTEKPFSKSGAPRKHAVFWVQGSLLLINNTILNGSSKIGNKFSSGSQFQCLQGHYRFLER